MSNSHHIGSKTTVDVAPRVHGVNFSLRGWRFAGEGISSPVEGIGGKSCADTGDCGEQRNGEGSNAHRVLLLCMLGIDQSGIRPSGLLEEIDELERTKAMTRGLSDSFGRGA